MYSLLVKLMVLAALLELGISMADFENCHSRRCVLNLEKRGRGGCFEIHWKPISVFPEEGRSLKGAGQPQSYCRLTVEESDSKSSLFLFFRAIRN